MPSISLFIVLVTVCVSAPYSKILATVQQKKLIFSWRGSSDILMLSNFLIAAQACAFLICMSFSEVSTQEPKYLKSFTLLSGFMMVIITIMIIQK